MKKGKQIILRGGDRPKRLDNIQRLFLLLLICWIALLATIVWSLPADIPGLAQTVTEHLEHSGVSNTVTAVLLNFRGYDTLLEVMVLLLAVIGAWSLEKAPTSEQCEQTGVVQMGVVRLLAPLMVVVAAYLVWQGSHGVGGAFQGGALLAAIGVLTLVAEIPWLRTAPARHLRIGLLLGPLCFFGVALYFLLSRSGRTAAPPGADSWVILTIEITCALSIGLTLALLFAGDPPEDDAPPLHQDASPNPPGD